MDQDTFDDGPVTISGREVFSSIKAYPRTQAAKALVKALPGMNIHAAVCWITAEQGDYHNMLGVTVYVNGRQTLVHYANFDESAQAVAKRLKSDTQYAGIIKSLERNDIHDQLSAIARSPWHLGAGGLAKAGGLDPYYARVFKSLGYDVSK
jgi:hypothetical protein